MVPNIEAVMGINENTDNKIKQALSYLKSKQDKKDIAPAIKRPIEKIIQSISNSEYKTE